MPTRVGAGAAPLTTLSSVPSTEPGAQLVPNRCLWKRNREREGRREAEGREREKRRRREERKADQPVLGYATSFSAGPGFESHLCHWL